MTPPSQFDEMEPQGRSGARFPSEPEDPLSRQLTHALEAAPNFTIPADFAARIAARVQSAGLPSPERTVVSRFGTLTARYTFAALIFAILLVAPLARAEAVIPMTVEMLLVFEFVAVATWLSLRPDPSR